MSLSALKAIITTVGTCNAIINEVLSGRVDSEVTLLATDSVGDIVEYIWDFGDGNRSSGSSVAHTWTAIGTYDLTLRVSNRQGATSITETTITIDEALIPITVSHNGPFTAVENIEVSLNATVSGDNIDTIECDPGDGSGYLTATGGVLAHTYTTTVGSPFTVTFRVTDTDTNTYTDSTSCTVSAEGVAPVAIANGPYSTTVGQPVQLTAAGSYTPGYPGDISVVKWEIEYGAGTEEVLSAWSPTITPTVVEGPINVVLTCTNSFELIAQDTTTLTVNAATGSEILDWFDDAPNVGAYDLEKSIPVGGSALGTLGFPRSTTGAQKSLLTAAQAACFNLLNSVAWWYDDLEAARALNPNTIFGRRIMTQEYLDWTTTNPMRGPQIKAITQTDTVDLTRTGGNVPSAFFLYKPRMRITNSGANNTNATFSFTVEQYDGATIAEAGYYGVLYNGTDFSDAEHVLVNSVVGNTITVTSRGYLSTARTHPVNSYFAMHQIGNGGDNVKNWCWNLSTACPTVGGMKCWEWMARWQTAWYKYAPNGTIYTYTPEVIIDDSSFMTFGIGGSNGTYNSTASNHRNCSAYNTATTDWGLSSAGVNVWGEGYEAMYNLMASLLSSEVTVLCGGDWKCFLNAAAGTEGELALDGAPTEDGTSYPIYNEYFRLSYLDAIMHTPHDTGPCVTDLMSKCDPQTYPNVRRFNVAMSCWLHTLYSFLNGNRSFNWCNEAAVELDTANHGRCISATDPTTIRSNINWLGQPVDRGYRKILGTGGTATTDSMISNGDFSATPVGSWTSTNGTLAWDETQGYTTNNKSLKFTPTISSAVPSVTANHVDSPTVNLVNGKYYTLCFQVKPENAKILDFTLGDLVITPSVPSGYSAPAPLFRPDVWTPVVFTWRQTSNDTGVRFRVDCGSVEGAIWIDQVYLFEDVFAGIHMREFDNGIVVANASNYEQPNIALPDTYQYLTNTGNDHALAGTSVTTVTIPAWDAAILVRESI